MKRDLIKVTSICNPLIVDLTFFLFITYPFQYLNLGNRRKALTSTPTLMTLGPRIDLNLFLIER